jgi:hypothetical protein
VVGNLMLMFRSREGVVVRNLMLMFQRGCCGGKSNVDVPERGCCGGKYKMLLFQREGVVVGNLMLMFQREGVVVGNIKCCCSREGVVVASYPSHHLAVYTINGKMLRCEMHSDTINVSTLPPRK